MTNEFWTISGVAIGFLALIIAYIQLKRTPSDSQKESNPNKKQNFSKSDINASTFNAIQGDNVSVNQTIINNIRENEKEVENKKKETEIHIPEFEKNKRIITEEKAKLRTYIYAIFASAKANNLDSKLEIRHVQDVIDQLIGVHDLITLEELNHLADEDIIGFHLKENEASIGPYTKIIIKGKYYNEIL